MFHLATPIASGCPVSDFDDISTILTHSSLTGSQKSEPPWQRHVQEDGQVFYVELTHGLPGRRWPSPSSSSSSSSSGPSGKAVDAGSTCSLCSTRSCRSCASEDTGYASDTDVVAPALSSQQRHQHRHYHQQQQQQQQRGRSADVVSAASLDLSQESLSLSLSTVADLLLDDDDDGGGGDEDDVVVDDDDDDDDGVDLLPDAQERVGYGGGQQTTHQHHQSRLDRLSEDDGVGGELCERLTHTCNSTSNNYNNHNNVTAGGGRSSLRNGHHNNHHHLHHHHHQQQKLRQLPCCTRTSSLCERHSNKLLCVPRVPLASSRATQDSTVGEHKQQLQQHPHTCRCGGQAGPMSKVKVGEGHREVVLHVKAGSGGGLKRLCDGSGLDGYVSSGGGGSGGDGGFKAAAAAVAAAGSWLETVLGIVPGHGGPSLVDKKDRDKADGDRGVVVVKDLTPDGPATKSKDLLIGDIIHSINGKQVSWRNLNLVLSSLRQTRKVRLTVESPGHRGPSPNNPVSGAVTAADRLLLNPASVHRALLDSQTVATPFCTTATPSSTTQPLFPTTTPSSSYSHNPFYNPTSAVNASPFSATIPSTPTTTTNNNVSPSSSSTRSLEGVSVLYMSMEGVRGEGKGERDERDEDVVYQFPREDSVMTRLRGSFFTLEHLLSHSADNSIRMFTVGVEDSLINVACRKEGKDLLIITAPAKSLLSSQLMTVAKGLLRLVQLVFGSVDDAFCSESHHEALDDLLALLFCSLLPTAKGNNTARPSPLLGYMDYLPLPDDVMVSISNTLTEYESADFADMSDSFYGCRRAFTVLGSMIAYKGLVTCSHLCPSDTSDVALYLRHSGLLALSSRLSLHQVLVWKEVFPTRLCHEVASINNVFGYSEPCARWFLMVVGVNNTLFSCILEAGGCAAQYEGVCLPDPFYVDQARAALLQLQSADIISACEIRLSGDGYPATTTADKLVTHHHSPLESAHRGLDSFLKSTASLALTFNPHHLHGSNGLVALSNTSPLPGNGLSPRGWRPEWRKGSAESEGSCGSGVSGEGHSKNSGRKGRLYPPPAQSSLPPKPTLVTDSDVNTCKLSSGKDNSLLVFCQVNEHEGVLITSPGGSDSRSGVSDLQRQVVDNFYRCVAHIHDHFGRARPRYPSEGLLTGFHGDKSLRSCREEGVMFSCCLGDRTDSKKPPQNFVYWVVGRKFKNLHSRELYVCFHESAPQNVVELAFRLSLGSLVST